MKKKPILGVLFGVALAATPAAGFPDKPIVVTGCQAPGGGNDRNLQAIMPFAEEALGSPLIAQYRNGAGGTQAMQEMKGKAADGHELVICDQGGAIFAQIIQGVPFKAEDAIPIVQLAFTPWVLTVHSSQPYATLEEFVAYTKENPSSVQASIADAGSADHYMWLSLSKEAGLDVASMKWMPYGGGAAKVRAMLAGEAQADMLILPLVADAIKEGTVKVLAVAAPERLPELPDVPTFTEKGYSIVDGLNTAIWAPAGTPPETVALLRERFSSIKEIPAYQEVYEKMGQNLSGFLDGAEYQTTWDRLWTDAPRLFSEVLN